MDKTMGNDEKTNIPSILHENYAKPLTTLIVGMAGSGKTTLMQRIAAYSQEKSYQNYIINLDPAVKNIPYGTNIDIRDTVDYKEVMNQYGLGPNGAIMTSLNLFATRFDQVINLITKKSKILDYAFVDTPGQIEAFTWSASGTIITESFATTFPTVVAFVIDTPRTANPNTFMSNMLYACSIMYKVRLPFVIVFNKIDIVEHSFATNWMNDFESFQQALDDNINDTNTLETGSSYMNSLSRSLSLVLEEFYNNIKSVGVSAASGVGMDDFFKVINEAGTEYENEYLPDLIDRVNKQKQKQEIKKDANIEKLMNDIKLNNNENEETRSYDTTTDNNEMDSNNKLNSVSSALYGKTTDL